METVNSDKSSQKSRKTKEKPVQNTSTRQSVNESINESDDAPRSTLAVPVEPNRFSQMSEVQVMTEKRPI